MRFRLLIAVVLASSFAVSPSYAAAHPDLPNAMRTPGALNADVTQATIGSTICVRGWTSTVRPTSAYTTSLKRQELSSGYAVHGDQIAGDYEEDHLISLELGGSPDNPKNLWPEPYNVKFGARVKDRIENTLHRLVCNGSITLRAAQLAISRNWEAAYRKYLGALPTTGAGTSGARKASVKTTSAPVTSASEPAGATAQCVDGAWSFSQTHSGTCSRHGGVARWL